MGKSEWTNVTYGMSTNPGVFDVNGAMQTIEENSDFPGIERVTIVSYCGRDSDDCQFYRLAGDEDGPVYDTLADAQRALYSGPDTED